MLVTIITMDGKLFAVTLALFVAGTFADFDIPAEVTFRLFTVNNKYVHRNLDFDPDHLVAFGFDLNKETKIITHGFLNNGSGDSCIALRDAFLEHHDVNVIIVDYERIANDVLQTQPNDKIKLVGEYVATFIDFLIESGNDPNKIHLLGHSLGAHVIGNAARHTKQKVARVSGLDPGLMVIVNEYTLSPDVAQFVDVIHTCVGVYGIPLSIGSVDFYPNGGRAYQPNCGIIGGVTCSHYEAVWFMARSIANPQKYPAVSCDTEFDFNDGDCDNNEVAYMGIATATTARGNYYLTTTKDN